MPIDVTEGFKRDVLEAAEAPGSAGAEPKGSAVAEEFRRETLGVVHPGHLATMELDPEYFLALKNYYSTWTISRKDAAISRAVKEFVISGLPWRRARVTVGDALRQPLPDEACEDVERTAWGGLCAPGATDRFAPLARTLGYINHATRREGHDRWH